MYVFISIYNVRVLSVYFRILLERGQMLYDKILGGGGDKYTVYLYYKSSCECYMYRCTCKYVILRSHYYIIIHVHVFEQTKFLPLSIIHIHTCTCTCMCMMERGSKGQSHVNISHTCTHAGVTKDLHVHVQVYMC